MKTTRRTAVLSFVILAAASAASAQTSAAIHLPYPDEPCLTIDDCPRTPKRPTDDCWRLPCSPKPPVEDCWRKPCEPRPFRALAGTGEAVSAAVAQLGKGNTAAAAAGLDGIFSGSASKGSAKDSGAVYAGAWTVAPRPSLSSPVRPATRAGIVRNESVSGPIFRKVDCSDEKGCKSETGKVIEDAVSGLGKMVDKLIGDPLRDSGDAALKKGNEDKKRAEEEWKKK